jgi:hypothetical protein
MRERAWASADLRREQAAKAAPVRRSFVPNWHKQAWLARLFRR